MSPYDILGVDASASPAELRAAYLRQARAVHPDVLGEVDDATRADAEARMRQLNEAWRFVNNPGSTPSRPPRPFVSDHEVGAWDDDAEAIVDEPIGAAPSGAARAVTAAGPILLLLAGVTILFGLLFTAPVMIAVGFVGGAVAVASFLLAPLMVMSSARQGRQG